MSKPRDQSYKQGTFVFCEGDDSYVAYVIKEGTIEISTKKGTVRTVLNTIGKGAMFGEMGIIDDNPRSADAYCLTDCTLTVIDRATLEHKLRAADPFVRYLMEWMTERVRILSKKV